MSQNVISRSYSVEHVRIATHKAFDDVRISLEAGIPRLDPKLPQLLKSGDKAGAAQARREGPPLWIFLSRDHGSLLRVSDQTRKAFQYDIGNPLTAERMTQNQLAAALYAPLRVVLYEDDQGHGVFEYDLPSSLFGQFGDERVTEIGRELDEELATALLAAVG